jgi:glycosidase
LPVQWTSQPNAGFTDPGVTPWMTINPDYESWNVESQQQDPTSILTFWKESLALRKRLSDLFIYGSFEMLPEVDISDAVVAYKRATHQPSEEALVFLNFSGSECQRTIPGGESDWTFLSGNYPSDPRRKGDFVVLRPWEAVTFYSSW